MLQFHMSTPKIGKQPSNSISAVLNKGQTTQLIKQLKRQNSFVYQFALSIVKGFGNMIGASIVFGLLGLWIKANLQGIIEWLRNTLSR